MMDPKSGLTKFRAVLAAQAMDADADFGAEPQFGAVAADLASSIAIVRDEEEIFARLWREHSISTVEEVIGLAVASAGGEAQVTVAAQTGLRQATVDLLVERFGSTPDGEAELADWSRYGAFRYETGYPLDDDADPGPGLPFGTMEAASGDSSPIPITPPPPAATVVSLIDEHISPIRLQADRGTCTAFAGLAALEYHLHRFGGFPGTDFSEQFAYWNMTNTSPRRNLIAMFGGLHDQGVCSERTWPYNGTPDESNDGQGPPPPNAVAEAMAFRAQVVKQVPARSVDEIRRAISQCRVVAVGIPVFDSWYRSPVVRKYGNITVPFADEQPHQVGHAIALVGYEDNPDFAGGGYFIVRNSWGALFGTASVLGPGYGTIPYRYIERHNKDAWYVAA